MANRVTTAAPRGIPRKTATPLQRSSMNGDGACGVAYSADKEDGQWCVVHHLKDRVDGDEYGAVLAVADCEASPD